MGEAVTTFSSYLTLLILAHFVESEEGEMEVWPKERERDGGRGSGTGNGRRNS